MLPDSIVIPMTSKPWLLYFSRMALYSGISGIQFSHQVAQKSTTVTLPFRSELFRLPPAMLARSNSGSCLRLPLAVTGLFPSADTETGPEGSLQPANKTANPRIKATFLIRALTPPRVVCHQYSLTGLLSQSLHHLL